MRVELPILEQSIENNEIISKESKAVFDIDTSVYSEERWEQNFPAQAAKEGLFQYIERIHEGSLNERVKVACMLKAVFCFIESDVISSYKEFAQMFNLATPEYTTKLIDKLHSVFKLIIHSSSTKN